MGILGPWVSHKLVVTSVDNFYCACLAQPACLIRKKKGLEQNNNITSGDEDDFKAF